MDGTKRRSPRIAAWSVAIAFLLLLTVGTASASAQSYWHWYLTNSHSSGYSDIYMPAWGQPGMKPLVGDWDGNRTDTPGVYWPNAGAFYLTNAFASQTHLAFHYGNPWEDVPVVGDWDANRTTTVGIRRYITWHLSNVNNSGYAAIWFSLGDPHMIPLSGDWDGDGRDTPAAYDPNFGRFHLSGGFTSACCYASTTFGNPGDTPLVGDWNGDGRDTIGIHRVDAYGSHFFLNDQLDGSEPEYHFVYGNPGDIPIVGDWNGDGRDTVGVVRAGPLVDPYPTSTRFGGANGFIDTEAEIDAAIAAMTPAAGREALWNGMRSAERQNLAARDAYAIWGESDADDNDPANLGSYEVWTGEVDVELDQWIPAADTLASTTQTPVASAAGVPAVVAIVAGCLRYCDDAVKATKTAAKFIKGVKKAKKPRPKSWKVQKPWAKWVDDAGSKPSKVLADNLGDFPPGLRSQWRPHHIIPAGSRATRAAQEIASNCGIHPNSAINGVWLPANETEKKALGSKRHAHNRLHTTHYFQTINRLMFVNYHRGAGDINSRCERVIEALRLLKESLKDGSLLY
jgi:hypothetical protein